MKLPLFQVQSFSTVSVTFCLSSSYHLTGGYRMNTVEQLGVCAGDFVVTFLIRRWCSD